jgi:hypothetical protein
MTTFQGASTGEYFCPGTELDIYNQRVSEEKEIGRRIRGIIEKPRKKETK